MSLTLIRASASLATLAATLVAAAPAFAEDAPDQPIIVVSAKDPAADPLNFAGSGNVFQKEELQERQVQDLSSLSYAAPNVSLDAIGTFKGVANFAIRGLGINSSIPSIDPAVGIFVDGVYQGINAGDVFDLLDIDSVTVLRGPQGVAFGRNTTGGAVLLKTADPTFEWEGHAGMTLSGPVDSDRGKPMLTLRGVVSGPLTDTLAIRIAALHSDDAGYFENSYDGRAFGKSVTTQLRGGLTWLATDKLSFTLKGEWDKSDGDGAPAHNNGLSGRDNFIISIDERGFYHSKGGSVSLRGEYELGQGKLTNIFGWRDYDLRTRNDIDSTPVKIFHSDTRTNQKQWSDELYYAADYGAVAVTAGGYIFHQQVGYDEYRDLAAPQYGGGVLDQDTYGIYAQADYHLADRVTLTGGLRWSREEKSADVTYVRPRSACSAIEGTCPITGERVAGENNGFSDSHAWSNFSPKVALAFKPADDSNLYVSWTRGYRSGGYNLRITQPAAFEQIADELGSPAFDEEKVDSFELGGTWQASDGLFQLNGALFWTEVAGMQREINVPSQSSGLAQSIYNTADARIRGAEFEAKLRPAKGLTLTADLGYTDAKYRKVFFDLNSDGVIDAADLALALPRAPKWSWGGSAAYQADVGLGSLTASAFFQHRSAYAYTDNNWGYNDASDRLDASLSLKLSDSGITFSVFGRNLLDEVQFGGDTQLAFAGGAYSDGNNRPFDPHPAAGTFSPLNKGRELGIGVNWDF